MSDDPYHYPADLLSLLIDTIPLLCRSKPDVLTFFRGCGTPDVMLSDLRHRVDVDRNSISKYEIVRTALKRLNEGGDRLLAQRREVIRRVTEWEDFSTCWPADQIKAKGYVADVRQVVNVKDSFTRMQQERDRERRARAREKRHAAEVAQQHRKQREAIRRLLAGVGSIATAQQRGAAFEKALNDLFALDGLSVREAFTITSDDGGVTEQIDGLIEMDRQPYIVEAKYHKKALGIGDVSRHLVRIYSRAGVHGLFISAHGYSEAAIAECERMLTQRVIILAELHELLLLLERQGDLAVWLKAKLRAATIDRKVLYRPNVT